MSVCAEGRVAVTSAVAMLPVLARFAPRVAASNLIALAMQDKNHANGSERRRDDQDQYPAAQCLNHPRPRGSRLSVAKRATLGESRHGGQQQDQYRQSEECEPKARFTSH